MNEMLKKATVEELSALLDTMWESSDVTHKQTELISAIVDELTKRGELPEITEDDTRQAYARICAKIAADEESTVTANFDWIQLAIDDARKSRAAKRKRWKKGSIIAASVLVATLLTNTLSSAAIGFNFLGDFLNRTGQAVYNLFGGTPVEDDQVIHIEMQVLQDKLDELGIKVKLLSWLPEGCSFQRLELLFDDVPYAVQAWFTNIISGNEFSIIIDGSGNECIAIKTGSNDYFGVGVIEHNGKSIPVFKNKEKIAAIWDDNDYQIILHGDLTYDEVERIVNSIWE